MEHGGLVRVDALLAEVDGEPDVVEVQHLGALVEQHALGDAGGATGVHQHRRIGLVRLVGRDRLAGGDQVLVAHVVGHVTIADQHHVA